MDIRARLIEIIEKSTYSQKEIARRAGQRPTWVSDLLSAWRGRGRRGQEPTISTLQLLAKGLGIAFPSQPRLSQDGEEASIVEIEGCENKTFFACIVFHHFLISKRGLWGRVLCHSYPVVLEGLLVGSWE